MVRSPKRDRGQSEKNGNEQQRVQDQKRGNTGRRQRKGQQKPKPRSVSNTVEHESSHQLTTSVRVLPSCHSSTVVVSSSYAAAVSHFYSPISPYSEAVSSFYSKPTPKPHPTSSTVVIPSFVTPTISSRPYTSLTSSVVTPIPSPSMGSTVTRSPSVTVSVPAVVSLTLTAASSVSTPAPVSVAHGGSSPRDRGSRAEDKEAEDVDEPDDESHLVIVEEPSPDPAVQPAQAPSSPRETSDARPQAEQQERSRQQILEEDQRNYHHLLALILGHQGQHTSGSQGSLPSNPSISSVIPTSSSSSTGTSFLDYRSVEELTANQFRSVFNYITTNNSLRAQVDALQVPARETTPARQEDYDTAARIVFLLQKLQNLASSTVRSFHNLAVFLGRRYPLQFRFMVLMG